MRSTPKPSTTAADNQSVPGPNTPRSVHAIGLMWYNHIHHPGILGVGTINLQVRLPREYTRDEIMAATCLFLATPTTIIP